MALDPKSSERATSSRSQHPGPHGAPGARPQVRPGVRVVAVVSTYHQDLTSAMLDSARQEFLDVGWAADDFEVLWVPGAFELPLAAQRMARRQNVAAVLCFGLILRGETTHDQTIAQATAQGLVQVSLETDKPVLFGVLTCQTVEQARARALATGAGTHDKGGEVARAALAMLACLETASNESSQ